MGADFGPSYAANGLIGLIFAATGPVAVILAVGTQGGLSQAEIASWIFGVFLRNGILTALMCWLYRQPLGFFWTIPGTVLVGPALGHMSFAAVVGAFFATGALILVLGLTGWVRRAMDLIPMPIVMAMVAGVFLRFGTDLVHSLGDVVVAVPMVVAFFVLSTLAWLGRPAGPGQRGHPGVRCLVDPRRSRGGGFDLPARTDQRAAGGVRRTVAPLHGGHLLRAARCPVRAFRSTVHHADA